MMFIIPILMNLPPARALTGATDITREARDCVEAELRARTVRIRTDRSGCSGVMINDHELRTAGQCFGMNKTLSSVRSVNGQIFGTGGWVTRVGGENWSATFDAPDHGEIRFEAPILPLAPVNLADLNAIPVDNRVVVAGYGWTRPKRPLWRHLIRTGATLKYYWGHLRVAKPAHRPKGSVVYEITPETPNSSIGHGDGGGPAFLVRGCRLEYIGAIVGRRPKLRSPTRVFVRPYTDLP